ncbi:MAG: transposase [Nostoc sp.]
MATYLCYSHAISYERLSQLFSQVFGLKICEGAIANLFETVKTRLDERVSEILKRLQCSKLIATDQLSIYSTFSGFNFNWAIYRC